MRAYQTKIRDCTQSPYSSYKYNVIILFIVLFVCHHFFAPSMAHICAARIGRWFRASLSKTRLYLVMINIICVFLRFACLLFQLFASHNCLRHRYHLEREHLFSQLSRKKAKCDICFFFVHWNGFLFSHTIFLECEKLTPAHTHTAWQRISTEISSFIRNHQHHLWCCSKWNLLLFPSWFPFVIQIRPNFQFIIRIFIRYIYFPGNFAFTLPWFTVSEQSSVRKLTVNKM